MKNLFFTIAALATIFIASGQQAVTKNINSTDFKKIITNKDGILLDVRTLYEYENGHLKEADQLNYYSFNFKENLLLLPKDKPIYVYCRTGYRSNKTAKILIKNGYKKVYNLQYGIKEWEENNFPIVKDSSN
jgi:rhodanese-related sulfurtransferase